MLKDEFYTTLKCEFGYFNETLFNWYQKGLPTNEDINIFKEKGERVGGWGPVNLIDGYIEDRDVTRYFGFDFKSFAVPLNFKPFEKEETLEDTKNFRVFIDCYGIRQKENKKLISFW